MLHNLAGVVKDSRRRDRLVWACAVVAPVVAFQGVSWLTGSGPTPVAAAQQAVEQTPTVTTQSLNPSQLKAISWISNLVRGDAIPSPMDVPPVEVQADDGSQRRNPDHEQDAGRGLVLTGIIESNAGTFASINRRRFRVGSEVAPGLVVRLIDAKSRSVTLEDQSGGKIVLKVDTPRLEDRTNERRPRREE